MKAKYTKEEVAKLCNSAFDAGYERGYEASPFEPDEYEAGSKMDWCEENDIDHHYVIDGKDYFNSVP